MEESGCDYFAVDTCSRTAVKIVWEIIEEKPVP